MNHCATVSILAALLAVAVFAMLPTVAGAQVAMPTRGVALQLTLGAKDTQPTAWGGSVSVSAGKVVSVHVRGAKAPAEGAAWKGRTRRQMNRKLKKPVTVPLVLLVTLDAPPAAKVTLRMKQEEVSFDLGELAIGKPKAFLAGQVQVEAAPMAVKLTDQPTDDDWPAAAKAPDGNVWLAYAAYKRSGPLNAAALHAKRDFKSLVPTDHGDQVRLMRFDGKAWGKPIPVTKGGLDVWRPAVAVAGDGTVQVIWSQQAEGNWDLYARPYDPKTAKWGEVSRLTTDPGADVYAVAATDPKSGAVTVVWQGWRKGSFDILSTALRSGKPRKETTIAGAKGNQWCPQAVFDSQGTLHVAYDTYERGNYDVKLTSVLPGGKARTVDVAATYRYEARPAIAVGPLGQVWIAYEEGALNWGKDDGGKWAGTRGERLYVWREVRVRCIAGDTVRELAGPIPAEKITAGYPRGSVGPKRRLSLPRINFDSAGRLWLLYRRHAAAAGAGERWISLATHHTGQAWSPAAPLANSINLLDNRPALVPVGAGVLVIHSSDHRTSGTASSRQNDLYCSILQTAEPAPGGRVELHPLASPPRDEARPRAVHPNETEDVKRIRAYRITVGGKPLRPLRGEFHRHTELTSHQDMDGTLEEMWRYGIDVAAFDWIGNGDHDNGYGNEYLWWLVQKQSDIFHNAPAFLPMFTYERSNSYPSGHRNVVFDRRGIRPLPRIPGGKDKLFGTPEAGSPDIKTLYAYLKHFGGICASHTSATGMGTDWRDSDPQVEPVVEIFQGCRQSYEHIGAPGTAKDAKDSIGGYRPAGFVWKALKKGIRLGFESSSDHYSTHISYAIVYARDTTRKAILDGLKARHCYAAQDNIILDVQCDGHMMGDAFDLQGKPSLRIRAVGTQPIARLSIIRGAGKDTPVYVYDGQPGKKDVTMTWTDQSPEWDKVNYYYVRVEQQRPKAGAGAMAWASPMWITVKK